MRFYMEKYIVTGATGHIGNNVVKKLLESGKRVKAIIKPGDDITPLKGLELELVYGDVRDRDFIFSTIEEGSIVFHFAGIIDINLIKNKEMWETNINGTINVVDACLEKKVKRLLYTSSVHAIEAKPGIILVEPTEFDETKLEGDYAKTKAIATRYLFEKVKEGLNAVVVYPSGVIGPNDYRISNIGQTFIDYCNKKLPAIIKGEYNFIDVRDLADGIISASSNGVSGEGYLLSGEVTTVYEMVDCFRKKIGRKKMPPKVPLFVARFCARVVGFVYRPKTKKPTLCTYSINVINSNCNFDNQKAKTQLGFHYRSNEESLNDAADWLMQNKSHLFKNLV